MAKLVDASDSKSDVVHPTCRFESGHRQLIITRPLNGSFLLPYAGATSRVALSENSFGLFFGRVAIGKFFIKILLLLVASGKPAVNGTSILYDSQSSSTQFSRIPRVLPFSTAHSSPRKFRASANFYYS